MDGEILIGRLLGVNGVLVLYKSGMEIRIIIY